MLVLRETISAVILEKMTILLKLLFGVLVPLTGYYMFAAADINILDIENAISGAITECGNNVAGIGTAVIARNSLSRGLTKNLTFTKAYGMSNIEDQTPATERTLFCIGSDTKHITATLVVHLLYLLQHEKNMRYSLSTLATDLDKTLDFPGSNFIGVTLEDMLSHRTGVANANALMVPGYPENYTRKQLAQVAARLPRLQPNRKGFIYNNIVFATCGYMAEILGEKYFNRPVSWEFLSKYFFFEPLNIANETDFAGRDFHSFDNLACPYYTVKGEYKRTDNVLFEIMEPIGPAGSLCMSPRAMAVWLEFLMARGAYNKRQIIPAEVIEETWRPRIAMINEAPASQSTNYTNYYGLGWIIGEYRGIRQLAHQGLILSYLTTIAVYPERNISLFISSAAMPGTGDNTNILHPKLTSQLSDKLLDLSSQTYSTCGPENLTDVAAISLQQPIKLDLTKFVGTFRNPINGDLHLSQSETGELILHIGRVGEAVVQCYNSTQTCYLKLAGSLWYLQDSDAFAGNDIPVLFKADSNDYVTDVVMPLLYMEDKPPEFHRVAATSLAQNNYDWLDKYFLLAAKFVKMFVDFMLPN